MRTLRSAYNKVISRNQMEQTFPFRNVYTGVERTRNVPYPKISWFVYKTGPDTFCSACLFSRHVYFQLLHPWNGFCRHCLSEKEDVSGGILSYVRHKTGQRLTVRIEPLIEEIIERYEPLVHNSPYLFQLLHLMIRKRLSDNIRRRWVIITGN